MSLQIAQTYPSNFEAHSSALSCRGQALRGSQDEPISIADRAHTHAKVTESIQQFVAAFLAPYINGQITEETDSPDRRSMMEQLFDNVKGLDALHPAEVEEIAFQAYLDTSVTGIYILNKIPMTRFAKQFGRIQKVSDEVQFESYEIHRQLIPALYRSIPKDFPARVDNFADDLSSFVEESLERVNEKRQEDRRHALESRSGDKNKRYVKLARLRAENKLFF